MPLRFHRSQYRYRRMLASKQPTPRKRWSPSSLPEGSSWRWSGKSSKRRPSSRELSLEVLISRSPLLLRWEHPSYPLPLPTPTFTVPTPSGSGVPCWPPRPCSPLWSKHTTWPSTIPTAPSAAYRWNPLQLLLPLLLQCPKRFLDSPSSPPKR